MSDEQVIEGTIEWWRSSTPARCVWGHASYRSLAGDFGFTVPGTEGPRPANATDWLNREIGRAPEGARVRVTFQILEPGTGEPDYSQGWWPMDAAPHDGTVILGDYGYRVGIRAIRWAEDRPGVIAELGPGWIGTQSGADAAEPSMWRHLTPEERG